MQLNFIILKGPKDDASLKTAFTFKPSGGLIGRNPKCDWKMPDSEREISNTHAVISYQDGTYFITDESSNGIELIGQGGAYLPKKEPYEIEHGDTYRIGNMQIQAALLQDPSNYIQHHQSMIPEDILLFDEEDDFLTDNRQEEEAINIEEQNFALDDIDLLQNIVTTPATRTQPTDMFEHDISEEEQVPQNNQNSIQNNDASAQAIINVLKKQLKIEIDDNADVTQLVGNVAKLLSASVTGMQHLLRSRAEIKNDLRCQMTQIEAQNNNPLKFAHSPEEAIEFMLKNKTGYLEGKEAIDQAMKDLQSHQVALNNACENMFDELLVKLSPEVLTYTFVQQGEQKGFGNPDARFWRAYIKYHSAVSKDPDWRSTLIEHAFAKHYESQINLFSPLSKM